MKSKKIIHLITTIERGGAEKQLLILVREQIKKNLDVEVFYLKGNPELKEDFLKAGAIINSTLTNRNFLVQILLFRKFIKKYTYLVHTHLAQAELLAAIVCKKSGFIISRHNFEPFWPNKPQIFSRLLSRYTSSRAAACIAISNAVRDYLYVQKEIDRRRKIQVIYYGFESSENQANRLSRVMLYELRNRNIFKIATIGRLVPGKNYPTLFKSLKIVVDMVPNAKLFIVGSGKYEGALRKICKELQVENFVIWVGKIDSIHEFLRHIDLFVFASHGEGCGQVLLEAMQANKPILAPNNSAIPEVLGFDYPGLYPTSDFQELAQRIIDLKMESRLVNKHITSYQKQFGLFDTSLMVEKILAVYNSVDSNWLN